MTNSLFYGDNLGYLREMPSESVDLIYLDPPFKSDAKYSLLFRSPDGSAVDAQTTAFRDTWWWDESAETAFEDIVSSGTSAAKLMIALRSTLGETGLLAYLAMMTVRLMEMHRVLKETGGLYLHCDPTVSHYVKIILDVIFGEKNFTSEVVWKRTHAHGGAKRWAPVHDTLLYYRKSDAFTWNDTFQEHKPDYIKTHFKHSDQRGRYQLVTLTGTDTREGDSGKPWRGIDPTAVGRHWAVPMKVLMREFPGKNFDDMNTQGKLSLLESAGLIVWPKKGNVPRYKHYEINSPGAPIQDIVLDIFPISAQSRERIGYPTQKPIKLLQRIILSSSRLDNVVLDPFCGCGTTVAAADMTGRRWIGIDLTHHAIDVIEGRLKQKGSTSAYRVTGRPFDLASAHDLARRDKYEFQWWAAWMVGVQSYRERKKGADR
ncbi:MAG: site-specific DNA-methyltransferase, partial [Rhizobiales bacterium]|nr:site-specific DNA-methyltransferase [Hyphomicrobiales bacterium]